MGGKSIRIRLAFLDRVHQLVYADAVIEQAKAAANRQSAAAGGHPCKADARTEVAERNAVGAGKLTVKLANTGRERAVTTLCNRPAIIIVRHDIAFKSIGVRSAGSGWNRGPPQVGWPNVGQVAIFIGQGAVVLPAYADVHCEAAVHLPVILEERVDVLHLITVNDAFYRAAHAEQTGNKVAYRRAVRRKAAGI